MQAPTIRTPEPDNATPLRKPTPTRNIARAISTDGDGGHIRIRGVLPVSAVADPVNFLRAMVNGW